MERADRRGAAQSATSLRRHHPRKRMIQYAAAFQLNLIVAKYWMPAFAGMTAVC
jgi:hypothetical protein